MNQERVLIVDDEPNVRFVLERTLKNEGYDLDVATSGIEALDKLSHTSYHVVLLDLNMKPIDGMQVLNTLRKQDSNVVVIILTAHSTIESAVDALRLGAFDYLFKPATPDAIRQRVQAGLQHYEQNLRRTRLLWQIEGLRQTLQEFEGVEGALSTPETPGRFAHVGQLVIDHHHRIATLAGQLLDLTTTEFDLLVCLVESSPKPVAPRQLLNRALGYDGEDAEARELIKWHIYQLRQKIEPEPNKPCYIKTVRYKGYLWSS
jgi:DNA-binding response OmpR family regulator